MYPCMIWEAQPASNNSPVQSKNFFIGFACFNNYNLNLKGYHARIYNKTILFL